VPDLALRARLLPNRGFAWITCFFVGVCCLLALGTIFLRVLQLQWLNPRNQVDAVVRELQALDASIGLLGLVRLALGLMTAVVFCTWFFRAYCNLPRLGARSLKYAPAWTIVGFLIPFANLVMPYLVAREVWQASDPEARLDDAYAWISRRGSPLIVLWWLAWLGSGFLAVFGLLLLQRVQAPANPEVVFATVRTALQILIVSDLGGIASGLLGIGMVLAIQRRQEERYRRLKAADATR
jgi:hypothetical protein